MPDGLSGHLGPDHPASALLAEVLADSEAALGPGHPLTVLARDTAEAVGHRTG
jgi:hypothetical protein